MKIVNSGEKITESNLSAIEKKLNVRLPEDYKQFMLKNNGGDPDEYICTDDFIETDPETGRQFNQAIDIRSFSKLDEIPFFYDNLVGAVLPENSKYIPIAEDSCGNEVLLCADEENNGKVYFGDHELYDPETELWALSLMADSFTEFLNMLHIKKQ